MTKPKRLVRPWQVRLAPDEDHEVDQLAQRRMVSKNDVLRHALRLLVRLEHETAAGARLLIDRHNAGTEQVEVWVIW